MIKFKNGKVYMQNVGHPGLMDQAGDLLGIDCVGMDEERVLHLLQVQRNACERELRVFLRSKPGEREPEELQEFEANSQWLTSYINLVLDYDLEY